MSPDQWWGRWAAFWWWIGQDYHRQYWTAHFDTPDTIVMDGGAG